MSKRQKPNAHCPVPGCRTTQPHLSSGTTAGIHHAFARPEQLALWVKSSLVELVQSVIDDVNRNRYFAYLTRWRQPEEMYYRALYVLFIAHTDEIPHIASGELPNSFSTTWRAVNRVVYDDKGTLDQKQMGLNGEHFTAMDTLNSSAHASFASVVTCIDLSKNREKWRPIIEKHIRYWQSLCGNLDYIEKSFGAGKNKEDVLKEFKRRPRMNEPTTPTISDAEQFHEISVNSWEEFEQKLLEVRSQTKSRLPLLYRGQEQSSWSLSTTLERNSGLHMPFKDYYRRISTVKPQIESFTETLWEMPEYPAIENLVREYDEFSLLLSSGKIPAYSFMAHLRHHAFPSPLLDWSRSPYVAAYFAFAKVSIQEEESVSIYLFSEAEIRTRRNQTALIFRYGPYVKTHRRHFLQQSEYTACLIFEKEWRFEEYEKVFSDATQQQGTLWKFNIPSTERLKVLKLLDEYNLNAYSLFASEEALIETLGQRALYF
jgi:hypothetical protein